MTHLGVGKVLVSSLELSLDLASGGGGVTADGSVGVDGSALVEDDRVGNQSLQSQNRYELTIRAEDTRTSADSRFLCPCKLKNKQSIWILVEDAKGRGSRCAGGTSVASATADEVPINHVNSQPS